MPLLIPIQPVPSQRIICVLAGQNCQIGIYQKGGYVYLDLNSNGVDMCVGSLAHNGVPLDARNSYDGFSGNLYFIDTQGSDDPLYTGFGTRWFLIYLTAAEVALTVFEPAAILAAVQPMTLSATLHVSSLAPGNFSVAHGLGIVPFLIEIVPSSGGAIWAQSDYADATNLYLTASDAGVTATVYVYTTIAQGLNLQSPAAKLLVSSPAPGNFAVPHGLGAVPSMVEILPTSAGGLWTQSPAFDATNLYLTASDTGVTASISVYAPASPLNLQGPATTLLAHSVTPGLMTIAHGLSAVPSRIEILMVSGGSIWAQIPAFDGTNVYLEASDAGVFAEILVYS